MRRAALFIHGKVVIGNNHAEAYQQLSYIEQEDDHLISGFYDSETEEFQADLHKDHFYNKEILLIRHSQIENEDILDPDLSMDGCEQSQKIAERLSKFNLKTFVCFSSPFLRCAHTADILQKQLNLQFVVNSKIAEAIPCYDDEKGYCLKNHHQKFPNLTWETHNDYFLRRESKKQFFHRIRNVLQHLPNRSILITHFGIIYGISRLSLCDEIAQNVVQKGIPHASITYIKENEIRCLDAENNQD